MSEIDYWECLYYFEGKPCRHRMTDIEFKSLYFDVGCPRCGNTLKDRTPIIKPLKDSFTVKEPKSHEQ